MSSESDLTFTLGLRLLNHPTMELKMCLSFLIFCVIPDAEPAEGQWLIDVPPKIPAVQGSCVVISCTYAYPKPKKILTRWRGFWRTGNKVVSTNLRNWKLNAEYKKRTQFLGKLQGGNCTMLLDGVRTTDAGPFYFRIELPGYKSYSFLENTVTIDVLRSAPPPSLSVEILDKVTASCSVSHTCPNMPPRLSWSRSGTTTTTSKMVNKWMWTIESVLTFVPLVSDFNKPLNCTVQYSGGKQAESSVILFI